MNLLFAIAKLTVEERQKAQEFVTELLAKRVPTEPCIECGAPRPGGEYPYCAACKAKRDAEEQAEKVRQQNAAADAAARYLTACCAPAPKSGRAKTRAAQVAGK